MSHATPKLRCFAGSLIRHEALVNPPSSPQRATLLPVLDKLRPLLATFMGQTGYQALILRATMMAGEEVSWLSHVEIATDGRLKNYAELAAEHETDEDDNACEVLLAHLTGLLEAFIGETLTLRLVHQLWPDRPKDNDFTQGNEHE
jgi:hypothetical protein